MNTSVTTIPPTTPYVWPACPPWCVRDIRSDEGTSDETVIHRGAHREVAGFTVFLSRTDVRDDAGDTVEIVLDDTEMDPAEATALGALLSAAAADAGQPQMAGHHWTNLDGWNTAAWARGVTSQDLARDELHDELRELVAECEIDHGEGHGPVGALLVRRIDGGNPHLVMLAGQAALEERITVDNAMWLLTCGEPAGSIADYVEIPGQGTFGVVPIHCRSTVNDRMQENARALVAQLHAEQAAAGVGDVEQSVVRIHDLPDVPAVAPSLRLDTAGRQRALAEAGVR